MLTDNDKTIKCTNCMDYITYSIQYWLSIHVVSYSVTLEVKSSLNVFQCFESVCESVKECLLPLVQYPHCFLEFGALEVNKSFTVLPCSVPDDARLVEGGSRCSGRLEMKHQGEWRTMNIKDKGAEAMTKVRYAQVACRQMGCGSVVSITHSSNSTNQKPAWEVNFSCHGAESTLRECRDSAARRRVQGKNTTVSSLEVICSGNTKTFGINLYFHVKLQIIILEYSFTLLPISCRKAAWNCNFLPFLYNTTTLHPF